MRENKNIKKKRKKERARISDKPSCLEGGAAGCFPVLQPVIRAIFSLQATKGLAALNE